MSDNHCWYVIGRTLRLALAYAILASLLVANPALAAEDTDLAAQTVADAADTMAIAETDGSPDASEGDSATSTTVESTGDRTSRRSAAKRGAGTDFVGSAAEAAMIEQLLLPDTDELFELVFTFKRKSYILSGATLGYQKGFNYYVPAADIARTIKFPSELNLAQQTLSGYFFNPENRYVLDAANNVAIVAGETIPLPPDSVIVSEIGQGLGDIYVTPEVLNILWSLRFEFDTFEQTLKINTPRKLPFELELERRKLQDRLTDTDERFKNLNIEYVRNGYQLLGPQKLRISASQEYQQEDSVFTSRLFASGRGDLLGTEATYGINTKYDNQNGPDLSDIRLTMRRRELGDKDLLPFGLKLVEGGDTSFRPSQLVERVSSGRGLYVSTLGNQFDNKGSFDAITIDGIAEPGWEAELYRGDELLDFTSAGEDGYYIFENVTLLYGKNSLRVVLYGPQGQTEERIEEYDIKGKFPKPGSITYEAGIVDRGVPFIDINDVGKNSEEQTKFLRVNTGINSRMSGFATLTQAGAGEDEHEYVSAGLDFSALGGKGTVEAYKQLDGGSALDARFSSVFAGFSTNLRTSFFKDFESREAGQDEAAKTFEAQAQARRNFKLSFANFTTNFNLLHTARKSGAKNTQLRNTNTLSFKDFTVSNRLSATVRNTNENQVSGDLGFNMPLGTGWKFGSNLFYDVKPDGGLDAFRLRANYSDGDKFASNFGIRQGIRESQTSFNAGASYDFDTFIGSANVGWDSESGANVLLTAKTTLEPRGEDNIYSLASKTEADQTALLVKLYHDKNSDGEFSEEDEPIEGAAVRINDRRRTRPSDSDGIIDLNNAGPTGLAIITYDQDTSPDPFLAPLKDSYRTILRPGTKPFINFPLILTGSIDGTIRFPDGRPVPGMLVQLIDQHGQLVEEVPTLSDGFYVFEFVKPGRYIVQVHPSHPVFVPTQTVTVASDDLFAYGVDLQILEQTTDASVIESGESGRVAHTYHEAPVTGGTEMSASTQTDSGVQSVIRAVRVGEYPDKVRLVLDLSDPISYQVTREKSGNAIYIDIPDASTEVTTADWKSGAHALFSTIEIQKLPTGGTQIKLNANAPLDVRENALLPASGGSNDRLYIDFTKTN